jgi:ubiquinone biosynthesis protein COQ4
VQTGLPMAALSIAAGQAKLKPEQQVLLTTQLLPWAGRAGARCHDLMCLYYETHVDEDLEALRQRWHIITAPKFIEASMAPVRRAGT